MRAREAIMLVGAANGAFQDNYDLMNILSARAFHVGPVGSGARMKLVVNLVIGLHRAVLAEGLSLAHAFGFDLSNTLDILMSSAAYSRMMDTKGQKMIQHDFTPQARLSQHLKDVGLLLASGHEHGANLPLSEVHHEILSALQDAGFGHLDNSAVIKAFLPED
jgi:3-hydroxyisobutyrate dehydrogenase-like beta-hydroxyacid dehydrogenase